MWAVMSVLAGALALLLASASADSIVGRWDITVQGKDGKYPSWVEFSRRDGGFQGRFVGRTGAVHDLSSVQFDGTEVKFVVPREEEELPSDLMFRGTFANSRIRGFTTSADGVVPWNAVPAPSLSRKETPAWGSPKPLFNGHDLSGWEPFTGSVRNMWRAKSGELVNMASGANLITERVFSDFKLHLEFKIPPESDSGVYLRGRYEIEIADAYGQPPDSHGFGSIYGFLKPTSNPARRSGEWQTIDAALIGRRVTITVNGIETIHDAEIPGITGGALDSDEGAPGPLLLQGDHGPVSYRNIVVTVSLGNQ
jgi:3-keto-disaccharide hydrolase